MTARENIQEKLTLLRQQKSREGQVRIPASALDTALQAGAQMLLSAVAAGAMVLGDRAPFGVALVAASGSGVCGGGALVGACFGYLCQLELSAGLRYAAAAILTFAVAFAFYDMRWMRCSWVMPLVAACMVAFTGIVTDSRIVWTTQVTTAFCVEVALTGAACWCYRGLLQPEEGCRREGQARMGLLLLLVTTLMALRGVALGRISLGGIGAGTIVLAAAYAGGVPAGAVAGLALGTGLDLTQSSGAVYSVVWGLSGTLCGTLRGRRRWFAAVCFGLFGSMAVLWTGEAETALAVLAESGLAGMVFALLPRKWLRQAESWLVPAAAGVEEQSRNRAAYGKLQAAAKAFHTLYDALFTAFSPPKNDNDVAMVFDRTAGRVCRSCSLWSLCWQREYGATFNALNDATAPMVKRGKAERGDFPSFFSSRCVKWNEFLMVVNEELTALAYRRQYNARVRENRAAVCRQYDQLSELLAQTAQEISEELSPDLVADRRVRERMAQLGLRVKTGVFRDRRGLLHLRAEGADSAMLERGSRLHELSGLLGVPMRVEHSGESSLSMVQQEPLMAVAGIAAQKKNGETVSGDAGTYFKCPDGMMYVLLCDGMGSGPEANRESSLAVRLLEQFLRAGVKAERALVTLASALALRGEETGGFTTVDLLGVDLFTGDGVLYKLGAAPTYVRQGGSLRRLAGDSLPAGLAEGTGEAVDQFPLHLEPGDCVLMISDGICGTQDDGWILEELGRFAKESPKELACSLLSHSPQGATDDRTALAVRIEKRK